ncbi:MAG: exodeoxyribonuclease small subunit [Actinomycetota bacterium]
MASKKTTGEPAGYAEAMAEIEGILAELDGGRIDVDVLGEKVKRAAELIEWCNARITAAEFTVKELLESLDIDDPGVDPGDFDDEDDDYDDDDVDEDDDDDYEDDDE